MNKIVIGVFAHPDDEAFGPSGTLLKEAGSGSQLHLILLTAGDAGMNPDRHEDLASIRLNEWRKAGALIGASKMHFLGYKDGRLNNQQLIEAGDKIVDLVRDLPNNPDDTEIEFISMDTNGVTGHIDHIVASRAALWAFYTLKQQGFKMSKIRLACLPESESPEHNINWLYMDQGRTANEIGETVDAREYRDKIIEIIRTHKSQRSDGEAHIKNRGDKLGLDYFVVKQ